MRPGRRGRAALPVLSGSLAVALSLLTLLPRAGTAQDPFGVSRAEPVPDPFDANRHGLALELGAGPSIGMCDADPPRCEDWYGGASARGALVWWLWGRVALEGAAAIGTVEYPGEYKDPILASLGVRVYFGAARRFYVRYSIGKSWYDVWIRGDPEAWDWESKGGFDFGLGYSWPVAERLDLGVYGSMWSVVDGNRDPFSTVPVGLTLSIPITGPGNDRTVGDGSGGERSGQGSDTEYPRRGGLALLAGLGNSFAWSGVSADYYFAEERFSAFGSVGYIPETDDDGLSGPTVAGGLRAYRGGHRHRGFIEASVSEMSIERGPAFQPDGTFAGYDLRHNYGPALQMGYRFAARGGFTLMVQGGVGYDVPEGDVVPLLGFGMGYTWP